MHKLQKVNFLLLLKPLPVIDSREVVEENAQEGEELPVVVQNEQGESMSVHKYPDRVGILATILGTKWCSRYITNIVLS